MDTEIRNKTIRLIQSEFPHLNFDEINPDQPIREKLEMDSVQLIALMSRLESEFDIEIPLSALESETLNQFLIIIENQIKQAL